MAHGAAHCRDEMQDALWNNIYSGKSMHVLHLTVLCDNAFYKLFSYFVHNML